jgi:hypothetical protein
VRWNELEFISGAHNLKLFGAVVAEPEELTTLATLSSQQCVHRARRPIRVPHMKQPALIHVPELSVASGIKALMQHRTP